jgi:hypothetical protein
MEAVANNPAFAKKAGVPQSVGQEFASADKGKKFSSGVQTRAEAQSINQPKTHHGKMAFFEKGGEMKDSKGMGMKKGGAVKKMAAGAFVTKADGIAQKGKTKAKQITMCGGGMAKGKR